MKDVCRWMMVDVFVLVERRWLKSMEVFDCLSVTPRSPLGAQDPILWITKVSPPTESKVTKCMHVGSTMTQII